MAKEFKSAYYLTNEQLIEKYDIDPAAIEDIDESMGWMEDYLMTLTLTKLSN
ncbi:MAG: hypothetical protein J5822_00210 [Eubacteriaceae bacterium]|nr:hypothetical protein [Eubacteriaceae bacterium]